MRNQPRSFTRCLWSSRTCIVALALIGLPGVIEAGSPGTVDTAFDADLSQSPNVSSIYRNGLAVQEDGRILVAGNLRSTSELPHSKFARLESDGSIDFTFRPQLSDSSQVHAVVVQRDQRILIGGGFSYELAEGTRRHVARLNPDGSIDPSFDPGIGPDWYVYAVLELPDGKILVGGAFNDYGGTGREGLVRLRADGQLDSSFHTLGWSSVFVRGLATTFQDSILIEGSFADAEGAALPGIARLHLDGSADTAFKPEKWTGLSSFAVRPDGQMLIGWGSSVPENRLISLNTNGTRNLEFTASVVGIPSDINPPGVRAILLQPNGRILIGGKFTEINGVPRHNIARLEADGSLDVTFDSGTGPTHAFDSTSYLVTAMRLLRDGRILVGGPFERFNGSARAGLAQIQGDLLPSLACAPAVAGLFEVRVLASPGEEVNILTSTDLEYWMSSQTVTTETGDLSFTQPADGTRFYRAVLQ